MVNLFSAVKAAVGKLVTSSDITQQEKDLMKNTSEEEMIMQMIASVKLQAPGLISSKKKKIHVEREI